ncbi:Phosphatidylcholine:ceramide cholinephosphotransferase 1 [Astathelohania contejeani]|uniref:Phosphatidylcholine:ceramide cholinephosphotransferase 1 n=1 Tax=Astathelohania contejeani TaxID=164912 RepID=A0ABQ7HVK9_9MICR|nr:Phosphatidylcholine:ceramide cholinephosphotransferase 1 [Thelohania contejeani]
MQAIKERYNINKTNTPIILIASFITAIIMLMMNVLSNIASYWSLPNPVYPALPDIFFDTFGYHDLAEPVDISMGIIIAFTTLSVLLRKDALVIYFRVFCCLSISYLLRMTTISATNLPSPNRNCQRVGKHIFTSTDFNRCGDLVFSGHTLMIITMGMVWASYRLIPHRLGNLIVTMILWIVIVLTLIGILLTHNHYSIDVILGVYISSGVWIIYGFVWEKYLIKNKYLKSIVPEN